MMKKKKRIIAMAIGCVLLLQQGYVGGSAPVLAESGIGGLLLSDGQDGSGADDVIVPFAEEIDEAVQEEKDEILEIDGADMGTEIRAGAEGTSDAPSEGDDEEDHSQEQTPEENTIQGKLADYGEVKGTVTDANEQEINPEQSYDPDTVFLLTLEYTLSGEYYDELRKHAEENSDDPVVLIYPLPKGASADGKRGISGYLEAKDPSRGTYLIDPEAGMIYFKFGAGFLAKSNEVKGTFRYYFRVTKTDEDPGDGLVHFEFPGVSGEVTLQMGEPKTSFSKVYDPETNSFRITLNVEQVGTLKNVWLQDCLVRNLTVDPDKIRIKSGGEERELEPEEKEQIQGEIGKDIPIFNLKLGDLTGPTTIEVTYPVQVKENPYAEPNGDIKLVNYATWYSEGSEGIPAEVDLTQHVGDKIAEEQGLYDATWVVYLNMNADVKMDSDSYRADVSGYVFTDQMSATGDNQVYVRESLELRRIIARDSKGNVTDSQKVDNYKIKWDESSGKSFTLQLPEDAGHNAYQLKYKTKLKEAVKEKVTVNNSGTFGAKNADNPPRIESEPITFSPVEGKADGRTLKKEHIGSDTKVEVDGEELWESRWKITITPGTFGSGGIVCLDQITGNGKFLSDDSDVGGKDPTKSATASFGGWFDMESVVVKYDNKKLVRGEQEASGDYHCIFTRSLAANLEGVGMNKYDLMTVILKGVFYKPVTIEYRTLHTGDDKFDDNQADSIVTVRNTCAFEGSESTMSVAETKFPANGAPTIAKDHDTEYNKLHKLKYDPDYGALVVEWRVFANNGGVCMYNDIPEASIQDFGDKTLEIVETLPEGMEYIEGSAHYWLNCSIQGGNKEAVHERLIKNVTRDGDGNWIFQVPNDGEEKVGQHIVFIKFKTKITNFPLNKDPGSLEATFDNHVSWRVKGEGALGEADASVTIPIENTEMLVKQGKVSDDRTKIDYTIDVNKSGIRYLSDKGELTLVDILSSKVDLIDNTLTVTDLTDSKTGVPVSAKYKYNAAERRLEVEVPDGKHVQVTYTVKPNLEEFEAKDGIYNVPVSNEVHLEGYDEIKSVSDPGDGFTIQKPSSSVQGVKGTITIKKKDEARTTDIGVKGLPGAEFKLAKCSFVENKMTEEVVTGTDVTDANGELTYTGLSMDTVYYCQETKAPEISAASGVSYEQSYKLDDTKYFFIIKGDETDKWENATKQYEAYREAHPDEKLGELQTLGGGAELTVTNRREVSVTLTAKKQLLGADGTPTPLGERTFSFTLTGLQKQDAQYVPDVTEPQSALSGADGSITFKLSGLEPGETYYYRMEETSVESDPDIEYDGRYYVVRVAIPVSAQEAPDVTYTAYQEDGAELTETGDTMTFVNREKAKEPEPDPGKTDPQTPDSNRPTEPDSNKPTEPDSNKPTESETAQTGEEQTEPATERPDEEQTEPATGLPGETQTEPELNTLTVTKHIQEITYGSALSAEQETFYVALFADEARTQRVSGVQALRFNGSASSSVTFTGLGAGVYYVGETDASGVLKSNGEIGDALYTAQYGEDAQVRFEGTGENGNAEFTNMFMGLPSQGYYLSGELTVTKRVMLGAEESNSNEVFYARVFADAALTDPVTDVLALDMNGGSSSSVVVTDLSIGETYGSSATYYVAETDENGTPLDPDAVTEYEISIDHSEVTLSSEQSAKEVVITNRFPENPGDENDEVLGGSNGTSVSTLKGTTEQTSVSQEASAPGTGDGTDILRYLLLMAAAALAFTSAVVRRRRRSGNPE